MGEVFKHLADADNEYAMIDATIRAHQHAAGAKGGKGTVPRGLEYQTPSVFRPAFILRPAKPRMPDLVQHVHAVLADRAYDAQERVLAILEKAEVTIVIPPKADRLQPRPYDKYLYQARH